MRNRVGIAPVTLEVVSGTGILVSTRLPGGSEAGLVLSADEATASAAMLWFAATADDTLGALVGRGIGRCLVWRFPDSWPTPVCASAMLLPLFAPS